MKVTFSHGPQQGDTVDMPEWQARDLIAQGAAVAAADLPPVDDTPTVSEKPKTTHKKEA